MDNLMMNPLQSISEYNEDGSDAGIDLGWVHNHLRAPYILDMVLRKQIDR